MKKLNLCRLFSFALSILLVGGIQARNDDEPKNQKMLIILLAGQSNMAGRGTYSELSPADTVTYPNVLSLNKNNVWVRAKHPLHWDKSAAAVGMGISFARELLNKLGEDVTIGLVPCAAGGTNIKAWINNEYFGEGLQVNLYDNFVGRAKKAEESGEIIGMLWHQGEANVSDAPETYKGLMKTLFTKMRNDLNLSGMPIVAGELGPYLATNDSYGIEKLNNVNSAINALANVLPNYGVATSTGLVPNSDNLHFTATSQVELGKRYADAFYAVYSNTVTLTSLVYGNGQLSPAFHPEITEYTCYLPAGTSSVQGDLIPSYSGVNVSIDETGDLSAGSAVSTITLTSPDGVTTNTYTIHFVVGNGADYTNLIINNDFDLAPDAGGNPVPVAAGIDGWDNNAWRPKSSTYGNFYGWNCDLSLTGTSKSIGINSDANGRHGDWLCWVSGNKTAYTEFEFSQTIDKDALPAGTYKVQCLLSSGNGNKKNTQRLFANNNVQYYGNAADYDKNLVAGEKYTFANHKLFVDNELKEMAVYVTISDNDPLKIGIRTCNKLGNGTVPAQQTTMFKVDYFRLTKIDAANAADATLAALSSSAGTLDFSPETMLYNVKLPAGTKTVTTTAIANIQDATVAGAGKVDVSSGAGVTAIAVTALDGTTAKTYTINYTVESGAGVDTVAAKTEKSVQYSTLTGIASQATAKGLLLKKITYTDGSMKVEKSVK